MHKIHRQWQSRWEIDLSEYGARSDQITLYFRSIFLCGTCATRWKAAEKDRPTKTDKHFKLVSTYGSNKISTMLYMVYVYSAAYVPNA